MHHRSENSEYALYPWFIEQGSDLVHPDDIKRFLEIIPYGKVFMVQRCSNEMVELYYGAEKFRVRPDLLQPVPAPTYKIGQQVRYIGSEEIAEISDILWHHKERRPFFLLKVGGKRKSRRFWGSELHS